MSFTPINNIRLGNVFAAMRAPRAVMKGSVLNVVTDVLWRYLSADGGFGRKGISCSLELWRESSTEGTDRGVISI